MRRIGDPEPDPRTEYAVRYFEGDPRDPRGQWIRTQIFDNPADRDELYRYVAKTTAEWNAEQPGHRPPIKMRRTIPHFEPED